MEPFYPLHVYVCEHCFLVQLQQYVRAEEIFYRVRLLFVLLRLAGLSMRAGTRDLAIERFGLDQHSLVVELASNDGYLLQNFVARGIPALGIEPAANVAEVAVAKRRADPRSRSSAGRLARGAGRGREFARICSSATTCWRRCRI